MTVNRIDHIGVVVEDLDAAVAFFVEVGLEIESEMRMDGAWLGDIVGLPDAKSHFFGLRTPGGGTWIELIRFESPVDASGVRPGPANVPGLRHICLNVDDLAGVLARLNALGHEPIGTVHNYEGVYLLCYVRGPDGIIVELAQSLQG